MKQVGGQVEGRRRWGCCELLWRRNEAPAPSLEKIASTEGTKVENTKNGSMPMVLSHRSDELNRTSRRGCAVWHCQPSAV
jgi:hypothetical protein